MDYDLMTLTRWTIEDIGEAMAWPRLLNFLRHLPHGSALRRELNGEASAWLDGSRNAAILADIYDLLGAFRYEHACSKIPKDKKRPNRPEPYARPERKSERREPFDYAALRERLYR